MTTGANIPTIPRRKSATRAMSASCRARGIFIEIPVRPITDRHTHESGYPVRRGVSIDRQYSGILVWGEVKSNFGQVIAYHLLVRRRPASPRPDLTTAGRLAERQSRVAVGHRAAT